MPKGSYTKSIEGTVPLRGVVRDGKLAAILDHEGNELGALVAARANEVSRRIEIAGDLALELPCLSNMQSSTPISLTGSTSQKTLIVVRIPPEKLFPRCRIQAEFEFSRNRGGAADASYSIDLNDYYATAVGQGGQIVSTVPMTTTQNTRHETSSILIGDDLRHQKYLQNNTSSGGFGNLNKYVDCKFNGAKGLSIMVSATLVNAADVITIESYRIEVTQ